MLLSQKKKIASVIVAGMKKPSFVQKMGEGEAPEAMELEEPEEDTGMALASAAQAMLMAFDSKDVQALAAALENAFDVLSAREPKEGE